LYSLDARLPSARDGRIMQRLTWRSGRPEMSTTTLPRPRRRTVRALAAMACALAVASGAAHADTAADTAELTRDARAFELGDGVPRNPERAARLYCEAASAGDAASQ
jgi:TPR repeat protein